MAQYTEYHPLKIWLDPASIAEIVAHIQTYLVNNPINSTTEIETIIHDYLIAHPELIGGVESVNGETGEVVLTADNINAGESVTIKDVLDSLQDQIDDIVASIPSDYQQLIDDVSDLKSQINKNIYSHYDTITSVQYVVYKVVNGVLTKVSNPSGYWKTLFAPVDCLFINGTATMLSGGLSGNSGQSIPGIAFIDDEWNVLDANYGSITAPHTWNRADIPEKTAYVVGQFSLNFVFNFQSIGSVASQTQLLEDITTEYTGTDIPLTFTTATGYYNKNKGFATYAGVKTAKVAVTEGQKYLLDSRSYYDAAIACLLASDDSVISTVWKSNNTAIQKNILITIPSGVSYILIQNLYNFPLTFLRLVTARCLKPVKNILDGKNVSLIGDSITEYNFRAKLNWAAWMSIWCNNNYQNLGASGKGFRSGYSNNTNYISKISSISSSADIIGVALSFNDIVDNSVIIGTINDTSSDDTVAGYANDFFDALLTAFPTTPIICYVQSPWSVLRYGNNRSDTWVELCKEICQTRGIPFYDDMYKGTVLKPWIASNCQVYYKSDNDLIGDTNVVDDTHPNSEGHKVIARTLYPLFAKNIVATGLNYLITE